MTSAPQDGSPAALPEETSGAADNPPHDSEDSLSQERVASELKRLHELRTGDSNQNLEEGAVAPSAEESTNPTPAQDIQGAVAPESERTREDNETYAPQRSGRLRGRLQSPDPYMLNSTIWMRHDSEASARAHGEDTQL